MFETCFTSGWQALWLVAHEWTARISRSFHHLRSNYPIPPGLTGTGFKLLLNVALPWLAR